MAHLAERKISQSLKISAVLLKHLVVEILASVALHQAVATLLNYALAHTAADEKLVFLP